MTEKNLFEKRSDRPEHRLKQCMISPMPDGMVFIADETASVVVPRALIDAFMADPKTRESQ